MLVIIFPVLYQLSANELTYGCPLINTLFSFVCCVFAMNNWFSFKQTVTMNPRWEWVTFSYICTLCCVPPLFYWKCIQHVLTILSLLTHSVTVPSITIIRLWMNFHGILIFNLIRRSICVILRRRMLWSLRVPAETLTRLASLSRRVSDTIFIAVRGISRCVHLYVCT